MEDLTPFAAGALLTGTELIGDYAAKTDNAVVAHVSYNALAYELRIMLRKGSLSLVNAHWDGISNLATLALGFCMGERLTAQQYVGAFLVSAGIFLMK